MKNPVCCSPQPLWYARCRAMPRTRPGDITVVESIAFNYRATPVKIVNNSMPWKSIPSIKMTKDSSP